MVYAWSGRLVDASTILALEALSDLFVSDLARRQRMRRGSGKPQLRSAVRFPPGSCRWVPSARVAASWTQGKCKMEDPTATGRKRAGKVVVSMLGRKPAAGYIVPSALPVHLLATKLAHTAAPCLQLLTPAPKTLLTRHSQRPTPALRPS